MDKTLLELADECERLLTNLEERLNAARIESAAARERRGAEIDGAESDDNMRDEDFDALYRESVKENRRDDSLQVAHTGSLASLNGIITTCANLRALK